MRPAQYLQIQVNHPTSITNKFSENTNFAIFLAIHFVRVQFFVDRPRRGLGEGRRVFPRRGRCKGRAMGQTRIYRGWRVVAGAGVGIGFGSAVFISVAFPLLAVAIAQSYGWSQTDVAKGASLALLLQALGYFAAGYAVDRWGSRAAAASSIVLFALSLAALAASGGTYALYLLACAMIGLFAAATNVVGYARAISFWFVARRGLALGVAASFQALGAVALSLSTQKLIAATSWSSAVLALAAFEILVCLPLVLALVEDDPAARGIIVEGGPQAAVATEPLARPRLVFAKLAAAFAVMGFTFYAIVANIGFILSGAGLNAVEIARVQALSGLGVLVGRIAFGQLLDRLAPARVGILAFAAAALFCWGLAGTHVFIAALAAVLAGSLSIGGESDLMPYLASRYFGRARMSRVLGAFLVAFVLGAAMGPFALAKASALMGDPKPALIVLGLLQIIPAALFLTLPAYPRARG